MRRFALAVFALSLALIFVLSAREPVDRPAAAAPAPAAAPADTDSSAVAELRREALHLRPLVRAPWVRSFLDATAALPHIATRTVLYDSSRTHFYWEPETASLPDSARARLISRALDETFYYNTRYGSPLAYARPFDLLANAGLTDPSRVRLVDFGYGTVGHLRLLASLGTEAVGVEVDPLLAKFYGVPGDQGSIRGPNGHTGRVTLVHGHFPGEVGTTVGGGYDVFVSKNTLKNGYIHPAEPVDPRRLVHLEVSDTVFVRAIGRALKPGGLAMIYNLCPAPAPPGKPYIPWADGRCPFSRELWEAEGFEVIAFDQNDDAAAREMGRALGWNEGPGAMDLEHDLFGTYTLLRKRKS
jgi:hypothetical protein